jgi:hypothetical protein
MGLTDDPLYKGMTEGEDTEMIVGTAEMGPVDGPRINFPILVIDYTKGGPRMEGFVAQTFDDLKKMNLSVRGETYRISAGDPYTTLMFAQGETAAHTAPEFWGEHTPSHDEHQAFQRAYNKLGLWLLMILTKDTYRQFAIAPDGSVHHKTITPMTDNLRKSFKIEG